VYTCDAVYTLGMSDLPAESIRDARAHFADVVDRADRDGQPTVITRRGKEVAAVVSIDVLRQYQQWEDEHDARVVAERMGSRAKGIPLEDVMAEILGDR
jgi:prevent-host-death family protein